MSIRYTNRDELVPPARGRVSAREFRTARNRVVETCSEFGTVGPSARSRLASADEPDFYVVDDHYGDDRVVVVEPRVDAVSFDWIGGLQRCLSKMPPWEVMLSMGDRVAIVVGPAEVRVAGWSGEQLELSAFLRELKRKLTAEEANRRASESQRLRVVRRLLRERWPQLTEGVFLVGAFATHGDGRHGDSVWLLHFGERYGIELDSYSFSPDAMRQSLYWATSDGELVEYSVAGELFDASRPPLLVEWILVSGSEPISGSRSLKVSKGAKEWLFVLSPET